MILAFHCATSGLVQYKDANNVSIRSNHPSQPHIVELAAKLVDTETGETEQQMNLIVKPDGWASGQKAIDVHGISNERGMDVGMSEKAVVAHFLELWQSADIRVSHSIQFFNRIIRIGLKRFHPDAIADEVWKDKNLYYCTQKNSEQGFKTGKLPDVYHFYTGKYLKGPRNSMDNVNAILDIYYRQKFGADCVLPSEEPQ